MEVTVITRPEMKAIVLKTIRNGNDVRLAWKKGQQMICERNIEWVNRNIGYVFVPEWQWATHVEDLWVGVEVEDFSSNQEGFEQFIIPERKYAAIKVTGDREQMWRTYRFLDEWFKESGYERDYSMGSYSLEANELTPVNPFDIPADQINDFNYTIYAPIK